MTSTPAIPHWAEQYIGKRWESGATGPDAWDCGTLVKHVEREHYGREAPHVFADATNIHAVVRAIAHLDLGDWDEVAEPRDGDGVILAHARYGSHVGVWIDVDGGGVLHCQQGAGVIFTPANKLKLNGWARVKCYRPRESAVDAMVARVHGRIADNIRNGQGLLHDALKKVDG